MTQQLHINTLVMAGSIGALIGGVTGMLIGLSIISTLLVLVLLVG